MVYSPYVVRLVSPSLSKLYVPRMLLRFFVAKSCVTTSWRVKLLVPLALARLTASSSTAIDSYPYRAYVSGLPYFFEKSAKNFVPAGPKLAVPSVAIVHLNRGAIENGTPLEGS